MNELSHRRVRALLLRGSFSATEREALERHLDSCEGCRRYAAMHDLLTQQLTLDINVPQLSSEQRRMLAARMEQQVRRERTMVRLRGIAGPVAWAALAMAVVLVAVGIFSSQNAPPTEPAAADVVAGSAALATTTVEPGLARFEQDGELLVLTGYDLRPQGVVAGQSIEVSAEWARRGQQGAVRFFLHLLDTEGNLLSQVDGSIAPATETGAAEGVWTSHEQLPVPEALASGTYQVWLGLYDEQTGERLRDEGGETAVLLKDVGVQAATQSDEEDSAELVAIDLEGALPRAHPQVAERFSLSIEDVQSAVSFQLQLPTRLPVGFSFIGAEADANQATLVFAQEGEEPGPILMLEQRLGIAFSPGPEEGLAEQVPLGDGEALYFADEVMAALAWQEGDMAYEWTLAAGAFPLETLQQLARSLSRYDQ